MIGGDITCIRQGAGQTIMQRILDSMSVVIFWSKFGSKIAGFPLSCCLRESERLQNRLNTFDQGQQPFQFPSLDLGTMGLLVLGGSTVGCL